MVHDTLKACLQELRDGRHGLKLRFKPEAYDRPVFPAFAKGGACLILDKPAGHEQLTKSLREMSEISGVMDGLRSHDIRRGAGREIALLPQKQINVAVATTSVARSLGHAPKSTAIGITQDYIGDSYADEYSRRVENAFDPIETDHLQSTFGI
jgi:hypothetical protein